MRTDKKGSILVKIRGNIEKMAHSTLENREIHALTDAYMRLCETDDEPQNFSCIYSWGYSDDEGTEIIFCTKERVQHYREIMLDFGSKEEIRSQTKYRTVKKIGVGYAVRFLEDFFENNEHITLGPFCITPRQVDCLAALLKRITALNKALRSPSIFPTEHQSQYYTKGREPKDSEYEDVLGEKAPVIARYDEDTGTIVAYCEKIQSSYNRSGKVLQAFLNKEISDCASANLSKLLQDPAMRNAPMAITVERCLDDNKEPDCDNINILGVNYMIAGCSPYRFSEHVMLIKSQVMDKNDNGYENYPSKITLERADRPHLLA
jgi:hypothetical protein